MVTNGISGINGSRANTGRPLEGKLAVITGSSRGIGAAVAHNLASKGCSIVLHYNSASSTQDAHAVAECLRSEHIVNCIVLQADLTAEGGPESFVASAKDEWSSYGSSFQIDILINNAGMVHNAVLGEIKADDFYRVYRINTLAPLLTMQAVMPYLPNDRSGRVVNVSSVSSTTGFIDQSIYGGSKAALEACTKSWARQLAERCTVNAVNPGPVKTEMWGGLTDKFVDDMQPWIKLAPLMAVRSEDDAEAKAEAKRLGGVPANAEKIAGVIGMLCSAESAWCTGQVVSANGGMRMSE